MCRFIRDLHITLVEFKAMLKSCNCGNSSLYVRRNKIRRNGLWKYQIKCNNCGKVH